MRQVRLSQSEGVVRHAHGRLVLVYDVGGKVPQRGVATEPRTRNLQRQVCEFAVGFLVDHGAQQRVFADVLQHISAFTTDQVVEVFWVVDSVDAKKYAFDSWRYGRRV